MPGDRRIQAADPIQAAEAEAGETAALASVIGAAATMAPPPPLMPSMSGPISDIGLLLIEKETPPPGYHVITRSPLGHSANLNKGIKRKSRKLVLCFKRDASCSRPLTDIRLLSDSDPVPPGYSVIVKTYGGAEAALNAGGKPMFLAYTRQPILRDLRAAPVIPLSEALGANEPIPPSPMSSEHSIPPFGAFNNESPQAETALRQRNTSFTSTTSSLSSSRSSSSLSSAPNSGDDPSSLQASSSSSVHACSVGDRSGPQADGETGNENSNSGATSFVDGDHVVEGLSVILPNRNERAPDGYITLSRFTNGAMTPLSRKRVHICFKLSSRYSVARVSSMIAEALHPPMPSASNHELLPSYPSDDAAMSPTADYFGDPGFLYDLHLHYWAGRADPVLNALSSLPRPLCNYELLLRTKVHIMQQRYGAALDDCLQAIRLRPYYFKGFSVLGRLLERLNFLNEARSAYLLSAERCLPFVTQPPQEGSLQPLPPAYSECPTAHFFVTRLFPLHLNPNRPPVSELQATDEAELFDPDGFGKRALARVNHLLADQLRVQGNTAFQSGATQKALQLYSQGLEIDPSNVLLYSNRAAAFLVQEDYQNVLRDSDLCLKLDPNWIKVIKSPRATRPPGGGTCSDGGGALAATVAGLEVAKDEPTLSRCRTVLDSSAVMMSPSFESITSIKTPPPSYSSHQTSPAPTTAAVGLHCPQLQPAGSVGSGWAHNQYASSSRGHNGSRPISSQS
ncbi:hypothetical protein CAOG_01061 [Capsaspora owczarzaki ATCC 30864]|uniref:MABP domain-containing protein n=1 Tax=Capsaspora owczarzaki (strain ATCC 30864) TaxID=595528 RepID=A0A0D2WIH9_CAPO3|nr:hypothetical protein CAOG_01061 [Capsaspora owczarzaki ATCC 30864]KJE89625.1 hypothetical protein CAOG_001061 [Capsaspora owczarzaki ATCC 30864]|eukprot:XP_004365932.2 hypothetical protein CAOG_01061 [Capsaspora owczarzaki ATCC 30864]